jgi:hypothetical protein
MNEVPKANQFHCKLLKWKVRVDTKAPSMFPHETGQKKVHWPYQPQAVLIVLWFSATGGGCCACVHNHFTKVPISAHLKKRKQHTYI